MNDAYLHIKSPHHQDIIFRRGEKATIGRNSQNEIPILDKSVSRVHALLYWMEKYPKIVDCHSLAGIEIDGEPVQTFELTGCHIIKLGKCSIQCELVENLLNSGSEAHDTMFDSAIREDLDNADSVMLFREWRNGEVKGSWESLEDLHKILCTLESNRRTGTLSLGPDAEQYPASILFGLGEIKEARVHDLKGKRALMKICSSLKKGFYSFSPRITVTETSLSFSAKDYIAQINKLLGQKHGTNS